MVDVAPADQRAYTSAELRFRSAIPLTTQLHVKRLELNQCFAALRKSIDAGGAIGAHSHHHMPWAQPEASTATPKIDALKRDLATVRGSSLRAVVFTQSKIAHRKIVAALTTTGYKVFDFTGSTDVKRRHQAIKTFQSSGGHSSHLYPNGVIFVITLSAGACGITLTAASRVYLMEPAIDPAAEQQAAGPSQRLTRNGTQRHATARNGTYKK